MNTASREPSDWLSPIIVKELRQGMRGRVFISSFLLIQLAMIVCATGGLVAASVTSVDQFKFFSILFWVIIGVPLLIIIPSLGNGTLRSEIQANSLELVYLTRLTPWRIVAGKWAALFAQGLLFVFSVLPYLVLRYFLGGIDLVNELAVLLTLLIFCALLTAIAVGFSGHTFWLVRGGQGFFFIFAFFVGGNLLFSPIASFFFSSPLGGIDTNPFVLAALFLPLALLLMFEIGTGKIAPAAEVRSFHFRTLGLLFLLAAAALETIGTGSGAPLSLAFPALLLIGVLSLSESPRWIRSIYTPYIQRGWAGRIAGRFFLYPGWPSGVVYVTVMMALASGLIFKTHGIADKPLNLMLLMLYSGLIFPVAVTRFIRPSTPYGFNWFLGIHILMLLIAILFSVAHQTGIIEAAAIASFLPTTLALLLAWDGLPSEANSLYTVVTSVTIGISLIILLVRGLPLLPMVRIMEKPAPEAAPAPAPADSVEA